MQDGNELFTLQWHNRICYSPSSRLVFSIPTTAPRVLYRGSAIPLYGMQFSRGAMRSCWGTPRWNYDFEEAGGSSILPVSSPVIRVDQLLQSRIFDWIGRQRDSINSNMRVNRGVFHLCECHGLNVTMILSLMIERDLKIIADWNDGSE